MHISTYSLAKTFDVGLDTGTQVPWDFTLSTNTLFIVGRMIYDFENDGVSEDVSANFEFNPS